MMAGATDGIFWTFGELEAVLAGVHWIDDTKRTAFQARLKNFHRLKFPLHFETAKGKASRYSPMHVAEMALALELTQLGLPPERAVWVLTTNLWPTMMALSMAARALSELERQGATDRPAQGALPMFLYFDPSALHALTLHLPPNVLIDLDEAANTFFYGGIGIVRDNIAAWTSGDAPRLSLVNVTAMLDRIAATPFDSGTPEEAEYRQRFFDELQAACAARLDDWPGSDEAKADHVLGLLEREDITDPAALASRLDISEEAAAAYIAEEAARKKRRADDGNSQA